MSEEKKAPENPKATAPAAVPAAAVATPAPQAAAPQQNTSTAPAKPTLVETPKVATATPVATPAPAPVAEVPPVPPAPPTPEELFKQKAQEICHQVLIETLDEEMKGEFRAQVEKKVKDLLVEILTQQSAEFLKSKEAPKKKAA